MIFIVSLALEQRRDRWSREEKSNDKPLFTSTSIITDGHDQCPVFIVLTAIGDLLDRVLKRRRFTHLQYCRLVGLSRSLSVSRKWINNVNETIQLNVLT